MQLRQHLWGELHRIGVELQPPRGVPAPVGTENKGTALEAARADHGHALEDSIPRGIHAFVHKTSDANLTTSLADVAGLSITTTTIAGRKYRVSATVPVFTDSPSPYPTPGRIRVTIMADGVTVRSVHWHTNHLYVTESNDIYLEYIVAPSAASHTYKIQAHYSDGTFGQVVGASRPAHLYVEDIGAA